MRNKEKDTINIVIGKHMAELRAKFNLSQKEIRIIHYCIFRDLWYNKQKYVVPRVRQSFRR